MAHPIRQEHIEDNDQARAVAVLRNAIEVYNRIDWTTGSSFRGKDGDMLITNPIVGDIYSCCANGAIILGFYMFCGSPGPILTDLWSEPRNTNMYVRIRRYYDEYLEKAIFAWNDWDLGDKYNHNHEADRRAAKEKVVELFEDLIEAIKSGDKTKGLPIRCGR